jgi:hypothetical protein
MSRKRDEININPLTMRSWRPFRHFLGGRKYAKCRKRKPIGINNLRFSNYCIRLRAIDSAQNPILSRLGLSEEQWLTLTTEFEQHFCYAAGAEQMMQAFKTHTHRKRIGGMRQAKRLLS